MEVTAEALELRTQAFTLPVDERIRAEARSGFDAQEIVAKKHADFHECVRVLKDTLRGRTILTEKCSKMLIGESEPSKN